jgi:hypothetical protein
MKVTTRTRVADILSLRTRNPFRYTTNPISDGLGQALDMIVGSEKLYFTGVSRRSRGIPQIFDRPLSFSAIAVDSKVLLNDDWALEFLACRAWNISSRSRSAE